MIARLINIIIILIFFMQEEREPLQGHCQRNYSPRCFKGLGKAKRHF